MKKIIKVLTDENYEEAFILIEKLTCPEKLKKDFENHLVYGMFVSNKLVGLYRLRRYKKYLQLHDLYVKQSFRHKGYGKSLLKHAEKICKKMGYKILKLWTGTRFVGKAYTFYSKCGYILIDATECNEFLFEKKIK